MPNSIPPPLPTPSGTPIAAGPPAVEGPSPLASKLRSLGLLPPAELKGEFALGAWWAGRIGGALALASVIFFGVYLNVTQNFSPPIMVGEIAVIGALILGIGLRLSDKNYDLGRIIAAAGLGVLQFTAWSTCGLGGMEKFGLFTNLLGSSLLQFVTAIGVVMIALWRRDKLFAQLAVIFAGLAVFFAIGNPGAAADGTSYDVIGVILVAVIGVALMLRGGWGSVGWLGLLVSQLCLFYWRWKINETQTTYSVSIECAALFSFAVLWVGGRLLSDSEILGDTKSHETFQLCSFFAPAVVAFWACNPAGYGQTDFALAMAVLALALGIMERVRSPNVAKIMLISALVFAAAGVAARLTSDQWIPWLLAAALAQLMATRMKSRLGRSATEVLAAVSAFYIIFNHHSSADIPWGSMVGIAGMATLVSFREDLEQADEWQYLLRMCGLIVLGVVLIGVQYQQATPEMTGWPWLAVGLVAAMRYRKGLIWAALPAYLVSCYHVLEWISSANPAAVKNGWHPFWTLVIGLTLAGIIWRTAVRKEEWFLALHHAFTFAMAFLMAWAAWFFGLWANDLAFPSEVSLWFGGALLVSAVTGGLRLTHLSSQKLVLALPGFLAAYIVIRGTEWGADNFLKGPHSMMDGLLWLVGLGLLLYVLIKHTEAYADQLGESMQRTIFGILLIAYTFIVTADMDKTNVVPSVVWACSSILIFLGGYLLDSKSFRMIGLLGLAGTTCRVFAHDLATPLSRFIAIGVIAVAFIGVAWLYGRMNPDKKIPQT